MEMIEMDEKKVSEAIDFIKTLITAGNDDERLYTAIEALEKQLPKKPIEHPAKFAAFYECPSCGDVDVYGQKNCDNCRQRLDWSE